MSPLLLSLSSSSRVHTAKFSRLLKNGVWLVKKKRLSRSTGAPERSISSPRSAHGKGKSCCGWVLGGSELNHLQTRAALPLLLTLLPDAISLPKYVCPVPTAHGWVMDGNGFSKQPLTSQLMRWHSLWASIATHKRQEKMPSVLHGHIALHQIPHKTSRKPQIMNNMKLTVCQTFHGIYPNCKWVSVRTLFREARRWRKIYFWWMVQHICLPIFPSENFCSSLSQSRLSISPFTTHLPALSFK